jgi:hypothetical protein
MLYTELKKKKKKNQSVLISYKYFMPYCACA